MYTVLQRKIGKFDKKTPAFESVLAVSEAASIKLRFDLSNAGHSLAFFPIFSQTRMAMKTHLKIKMEE